MAKPPAVQSIQKIRQGRVEEAQQLYSQLCAREHPGELPLAALMRMLLRGQLEIAARRFREAEHILRQAAALERQVRLTVLFGSAHLLLAHLYFCWGRQRDALAELAPLLEQCERDDLPGIITLEGAAAVPLRRLAIEHEIHAPLAARLLENIGASAAPPPAHIPETGETLSPRELEVLHLIAQGASNRAIAERLILSEQTVKSHVARILRKFEVDSRTQAAARAHALGIVDLAHG